MKTMIGKHVIVRSTNAGVFFGVLTQKDGDEVTLSDARKIWSWKGANSVEDIAVQGFKSTDCKITVPVSEIGIFGVNQILLCTEVAISNINSFPPWKQ